MHQFLIFLPLRLWTEACWVILMHSQILLSVTHNSYRASIKTLFEIGKFELYKKIINL